MSALRYTPDIEVTEARLRAAIDNDELKLLYQPKLALRGEGMDELEGVEALVRWDDPLNGLRSPMDFIPLAEKTGLIIPLSFYVLRHAVTQTRLWHEQGLPLTVSVNLPAIMVNDLSLPDQVAAILNDAGLPSDKLILEITETGAMVDFATTIESLTRLRVKGVGLSIDDFGTGYSSLVELYRMPFSELKVDRSFVMECDQAAEARTIVEAIVQLAHKMELTVCAEGVESKSVLDLLRSLGCQKVQGFFISRPIHAAEVTEFARRFSAKSRG